MDANGVLVIVLAAGVIALLALAFNQYRRLQDARYRLAALERDRVHADGKLKLADQQMAALADASFDALLLIDSDHRIVLANKAARDLFGVKGPLVGATLMTITRHHELDTLAADILNGEPALDTQIEIKENSYRVRGTIVSLGDRKGGPQEVALALQDISELLRLSRARRDMVANFSHDLRTPISSIRLLVDTLSHNFGKNPDKDKRLLGRIAGETDSLQHMTQELIDLSMIESGKAIIRMVPVNFSVIVQDAFNLMSTQAESKKLTLSSDVPPELRVLIDPDQTRRVITNVIHNGIKFTPKSGEIALTTTPGDHLITVRIKDSGPGIPPQDRTRVFERFYQVDSSRSAQSGGSGLGLSIAKHIIEAQGGTIWAEAGVPGGAVICFTIPLAEESTSAVAAKAPEIGNPSAASA